jgi:hypothetical protein
MTTFIARAFGFSAIGIRRCWQLDSIPNGCGYASGGTSKQSLRAFAACTNEACRFTPDTLR